MTLLQKRKSGALEKDSLLESIEGPKQALNQKRTSEFSINIRKGTSLEESKHLFDAIDQYLKRKISNSTKPSNKIHAWKKLMSLVFWKLSKNDLVESLLFGKITQELTSTRSMIYRNYLASVLIKIIKLNNKIVTPNYLEIVANLTIHNTFEDQQSSLIDLSSKLFKALIHSPERESAHIQKLAAIMLEMFSVCEASFEQRIKFFKNMIFLEKTDVCSALLNQLITNYPSDLLKMVSIDKKFLNSVLNCLKADEENENFTEMFISFLLKSRGKEDVETQIQVLGLIGKLQTSGFNFKRFQNKIDNLFIYICELCWNFSLNIRREATKQLELLQTNNEELVLQTIRKQSLSDYQKKDDDKMIESTDLDLTQTRENRKEIYDDKVIGVLIHLLEDEFSEIRISALRILRSFGACFSQFANDSRDLLFDMLNDDSDNVRIEALRVLSELHKNLKIKQHELESIMYNVKEDSVQLRLIIYKFLENVRLKNSADTNQLLGVIISNIEKFKSDSQAIYRCLRVLGMTSYEHLGGQIKTILNIDEHFLIQEPDWRNPLHIGRMIVVSNALKFRQNLSAELPFYFYKHRDFLSDLYPEFIENEQVSKCSQRGKNFQNIFKERCSYLFQSMPNQPQLTRREDPPETIIASVNYKDVFERIISSALRGMSGEAEEASKKVLKESKNITKTYKLKKESQDQNLFKLRFLYMMAKFSLRSIKQKSLIKQQSLRTEFLHEIDAGERPMTLSRKKKVFQTIRNLIAGFQKLQSCFRNKGKKLNFLFNLMKLSNLLTFISSFSLNSLTSIIETNAFLEISEVLLSVKEEMGLKLAKIEFDSETQEKILAVIAHIKEFASKALNHPDRLKKFESRRIFHEDFRALANSLSSLLMQFTKMITELTPMGLKLKNATIVEPSPKKDEYIEISNRHLAPISILIIFSNFKEADILHSLVQLEYQNNTKEFYRISRDDIVYKDQGDSETTVKVKYFLEKIRWLTETNISLRCVDIRPLWIFSKHCVLGFFNSEADDLEIFSSSGKIFTQANKLIASSKKTHITLKQKYHTN